MTSYFTHYWTNNTWDFIDGESEGYLDHTASNLFRARGVRIGDWIYIVTVKKGILLVAAKLRVDHLVGRYEAQRILSSSDLWEADDHVISDKERSTNYDCRIPKSVYPNLYFESSNRPQPPRLKNGGLLDQQTLRGVRQLTSGGAKLLDQYMQDCN